MIALTRREGHAKKGKENRMRMKSEEAKKKKRKKKSTLKEKIYGLSRDLENSTFHIPHSTTSSPIAYDRRNIIRNEPKLAVLTVNTHRHPSTTHCRSTMIDDWWQMIDDRSGRSIGRSEKRETRISKWNSQIYLPIYLLPTTYPLPYQLTTMKVLYTVRSAWLGSFLAHQVSSIR